jgi:tetratricopeptide (TPR) repeat protein
MSNKFFIQSEFYANLEHEIICAMDTYERRQESGMKDNSLAKFDFTYVSDTIDKLQLLADFLIDNYGYEIDSIKKREGLYELIGYSVEFPVDKDNLIYWVVDLYCKGYEFDCKLDGYGAMENSNQQIFPKIEAKRYDEYFDLAMTSYDNRNFGMAFVNLSIAIKIDPNDPNAWYSRAIVKEDLYDSKSARKDYDMAINLAPDFTDAIINRAANKDESGEYLSAIQDYTLAIKLQPQNAAAYFNRGNSKFNIADKQGACADWRKASELGDIDAQKNIDRNCKSENW